MRQVLLIIAAALIGLSWQQSARADQAWKDAQLLQGSWTGMYAEQNGQQTSYDDVGFIQAMVRGDRYMIAFGSQPTAVGEIRLNTGSSPRQIDIRVIGGPENGAIYQGIYDIQGSTHQICLAPPGLPRPSQFSTFPGSGYSLYVWLRAERVNNQGRWPAPWSEINF